MREPWRTLFEGYDDHWLLAAYLQGDEPEWGAMLADPKIDSLSTGEKILLDVACSFRTTFHRLDRAHRVRIAQALLDLP